ncbi:MAG: T9SS C-terminal target domain-containing protein [Bacteroidetes bacterium]|nr:MAG: T9SS C-terminal target domain-containing protein [Bacteroidota bacterium]
MQNFKSFLLLLFLLVFTQTAFAQQSKPQKPENITPTNFDPATFQVDDKMLQGIPRANRLLPSKSNLKQVTIPPRLLSKESFLKIEASENGLPLFISGQLDSEKRALPGEQQVQEYLMAAADLMKIVDPVSEFTLTRTETDELGFTHYRMQQYYHGLPVYGGQVIVHSNAEAVVERLNGRYFPTPMIKDLNPSVSENMAETLATNDLSSFTTVKELSPEEQQLVASNGEGPELIIYHIDNDAEQEVLCWKVNVIPNLLENWDYYIDAHSGAIIHKINNSCTLYPELLRKEHGHCQHNHGVPLIEESEMELGLLGGTTGSGVDLKGVVRTINVYEDGGEYVMLDVGREMFDQSSDIPNNMSGAILTLDAQNTNPASNDFDASYIFGPGNNWNDPKAVSAHFHAAESYEYFRGVHSRNSINGSGGNIVAFINVAETDGSGMDNAFWNGAAMFYGNGSQAFSSPLQKSLDTGGHEMTHGVVGSSAGLIYQGQSGALNESFADVFGVMIDPDDWQLGEDIVNSGIFTSGALRDLSDPNQGGNGLSFPGWQPAHMNEYEDLPFTSEGDNGGVHVNSGIPNHAFYLYATSVGNSDARRVYYRALTTYLTNQSQFIDCRLAVIQSASDIFGSSSNQVAAAASAFDQVGITDGSGSGGTEELDTNEGDEYILLTNGSFDALYLFDGTDFPVVSNAGVLSRPSVTDDGTLILFVDDNNDIKVLELKDGTGQYDEYYLETNPQQIWRNVAISKDGTKLAALTTDWDNYVFIFDFTSTQGQYIEILNPTSQQGVFTDDVQYADFIEWDYSGELLLFDAYNVLDDDFGNTSDYWDIGLIHVWDNGFNFFGNGYVFKIFSGLPDNTGVGDPTFSKNSPNIIALDFIGDAENFSDFSVIAVDTEAGEVGYIFEDNLVLGRPNYSMEDDQLIFDALSQSDDEIIAIIDLNADKITPAGDAQAFITGSANWGLWFAVGERDFTSTEDFDREGMVLTAAPNPFVSQLEVQFELTDAAEVQINVYDLTGKVQLQFVESFGAGLQKEQIDFSVLPNGPYFVELRTNEQVGVIRVLKAD